MPKLAVGVPVYNGEKWLATTIDSLLDQTFDDIRIIICDNASDDLTSEIALDLQKRDPRIHYHRNQSNIGPFGNFDLTFDLSDSEYFKWCAVGDTVARSFLASAVPVLDGNPNTVLVYSGTRLVGDCVDRSRFEEPDLPLNSTDTVLRYTEFLSRTTLNYPFHGLIRSEALAKTGLNKVFSGSDVCVVASLLLQGPFEKLPGELLARRIDPETATAVKSSQDLRKFLSTDHRAVSRFPAWKLERQLVWDVIRRSMPMRTRLALFGYLAKRLAWRRKALWKDVATRVSGRT